MFVNMTVDFGGVNYPKPYRKPGKQYIGFVAIFSGCYRAASGKACPGCQNQSLWRFDAPCRYTMKDIRPFVERKMVLFRAVCNPEDTEYYLAYLGGEPMDQDMMELRWVYEDFAKAMNMPNLPLVVFSGYADMESLSLPQRSFVDHYVSYLKLGPYLGDDFKKSDLESGLATENQLWLPINR